jgi:mannan endo-1,4-beta-mannosidase
MKPSIFSQLFFVLFIAILSGCTPRNETLTVIGKNLYDVNNEQVVLRGINEMFIWSDDVTGEILMPEIAKTGANAVRIVWLSDEDSPKATPQHLDIAIQNCIDNGMFPMPELHGATGEFSKLQNQVDYWVKPEVVAVLKKHEPYIMINIANECGAHGVEAEEFIASYKKAIERIRKTGLKCPLVIDASGWGQDLEILLETGPELLEHDPFQNILLSVHMWWVADDGSTERIVNGIERSVEQELPLIVGEFAPMGVGCKRSIDYKTIMEKCEKHNIGWLAWSWGGSQNGDCAEMDMTRGKQRGLYEGLTDWGLEVAVTNPYSIQNTSEKTRFLKEMANGK